MNQVIFEMDEKILDNIKAVFADTSKIEVGVLTEDKTLGKIAAAHEFGAKIPVTAAMSGFFKKNFGFWLKKAFIELPQRSFMRKTVAQKSEDFIGELQASQDSILDNIVSGQWSKQLANMGSKWADYIRECFDTQGFGQWKPLHPITTNDTPLIRTGKLRDSIDSKVVEK